MLAEIFLLRLELMMRAAAEQSAARKYLKPALDKSPYTTLNSYRPDGQVAAPS